MAYQDWNIRGPFVVACNCDWGCPCQFISRPTNGDCHAVIAMHIAEGHFGDVRLDGARFAAMLAWPGAIHEGHGQCLPILDEGTSEEQRAALLAILSGEETEPGATVFNVFAGTYETVHEPRIAPIEIEVDVPACTASVHVPGLIEVSEEPIRNPITGEPHRVQVTLPTGFEYRQAEYGNSRGKLQGVLAREWPQGHGHLFEMNMTPYGPA